MFGKVSWVLVPIGIIIVILGFIPIPYPKIVQYNEVIDVKGSLQPTELDFLLEAGTWKNITYSLKNETYLQVELLKSNIDFYITDSAEKMLFNAGRVTGEHGFGFKTPKNDNYTLYFDNTFDKTNNKTISYRL